MAHEIRQNVPNGLDQRWINENGPVLLNGEPSKKEMILNAFVEMCKTRVKRKTYVVD